jgi:hypothetical protein
MLQTWLPALVEAGIPFLGGLYGTLLGFGVIPRRIKADENPDQAAKRIGLLKALGPFVMLFGVYLFFTNMPTATPAPQVEWRRVITSDGVCSVEMPGEPKVSEQQLNSVVRRQEYRQPGNAGTALSLTLSETEPVGLQADAPEAAFDLYRDNVLKVLQTQVSDAKLVADEKITQNNLPGRAIQIAYGNAMLSIRFYIVGTHLYQLTANRTNEASDPIVRRFMESAKLNVLPAL